MAQDLHGTPDGLSIHQAFSFGGQLNGDFMLETNTAQTVTGRQNAATCEKHSRTPCGETYSTVND